MKTVSIVMCTYNGEQFLREQLDSILAQTYPIHELIIQDDCSTDHTADIVREYARQYPFIRFYANISNLGFNRNFQDALSKAEGDISPLPTRMISGMKKKSPHRWKPSATTTCAFPPITPVQFTAPTGT